MRLVDPRPVVVGGDSNDSHVLVVVEAPGEVPEFGLNLFFEFEDDVLTKTGELDTVGGDVVRELGSQHGRYVWPSRKCHGLGNSGDGL